jgi:Zn-dependent peptidase ImmA (M78 family)
MRIAVSASVLEWAIERSGERATLYRKFPYLAQWANGKGQPTLRQLEEFAKAVSIPFGYLLLPDPPEEKLSIPHFRTLADKPAHRVSPDLLETVRTMQRRQDWMRDYLLDQGVEPLPFVHSANIKSDPIKVASEIRSRLGLSEAWASEQPNWTSALRSLMQKIEEAGILVVVNGIVGNNTHKKLSVDEFRGFVLVDEFAPLVFVNGADGKAAQMFTLAHELAHVWIGRSAAFDLRSLQPAHDRTEEVCNHIAAEFLVPADQLAEYWPSVSKRENRFQAIARHFKISEIVAARRALDLNLITKKAFFEFYETYQKRELAQGNDQEGGNFYATQNLRIGRRFGEAVVRATREGRLLYREAYQLVGLYGKSFARYTESALGMAL